MRVLRGPEFISVPLIRFEENLAKQHRSRLLQQICLSLPTPARPLTARVPALPDPAARPAGCRGRRAPSPGRGAPGQPGTALRARSRPSASTSARQTRPRPLTALKLPRLFAPCVWCVLRGPAKENDRGDGRGPAAGRGGRGPRPRGPEGSPHSCPAGQPCPSRGKGCGTIAGELEGRGGSPR